MRKTFFGLMLSLALTSTVVHLNASVFSQERDYIATISSKAYQSSKVEDWGINRWIKKGLIEEVKNQVTQGFNVNSIDDFGWTPLMYACLWEKLEISQLLLEYGSDVSSQSHQGVSPLVIAVNMENVPLINLLLDTGSDINSTIKCKKDQKDQLNYVSKLVLNHGAPSLKNNCGDTNLIFAANYCRVKSVSSLLARGADADGRNEEGITPLMKAGHHAMDVDCGAEISDLLLNHNADVNAVDKKGYTALMYAVISRSKAKVEMLLEKKADVSVVAKDGNSALSLAREIGNEEITDLISKAVKNNMAKERRK